MSMECHEVHDLVAAWLDDELSPGQRELMDRHLERCEACAGLVAALAEQDLRPPPAPDTAAPGFWDALEARLAAEQAVSAEAGPVPAAAAPSSAASSSMLQLRPVVVALYAALLLLSLGFAGFQSWRVAASTSQVQALQVELDHYQRLEARSQPNLPVEAVPIETMPVAVHTPYRGSL